VPSACSFSFAVGTIAILDAWPLIDVCHRIRQLILHIFGLRHKTAALQIFVRALEQIDGLRYHVQHIWHREYNRYTKKRIRCGAHFHGFRRSLRQNVIQSYRAICFPVETRRHVHTTHTNRSSLIGLYFMRPEHPSIFRMPPTISINDLTWRSLDYFVKQSP